MNARIFRPVGLLALLMLALLTGCKKNSEEAQPDMGTRLEGQYTLSEVELNGTKYPAGQTNLKGGVSVTRVSASSIKMAFAIVNKKDGSDFISGSAEDVSLSEAGNGQVNLSKDGDTIGYASGNKLSIKGVDDDGTQFVMTLTK
jgi:hypothetical protein